MNSMNELKDILPESFDIIIGHMKNIWELNKVATEKDLNMD